MKEHKYKAWHKELKQMFEMSIGTNYAPIFSGFNKYKHTLTFQFFDPELIRLPFTGLHDKSKSEFYDSDIFTKWYRAPWDDEVPVKITFLIEWQDSGWWANDIISNEYSGDLAEIINDDYGVVTAEKVGTRFENPELLEQ